MIDAVFTAGLYLGDSRTGLHAAVSAGGLQQPGKMTGILLNKLVRVCFYWFLCEDGIHPAVTERISGQARLKEQDRLCIKGRTEQATMQAPEMELRIVIPEEIRVALQP